MTALKKVLAFGLLLVALAGPVSASPRTDAVLDALRIGDLLVIMQTEAELSAAELDETMLGGTGGRGWGDTVARINDAVRLEREIRDAFGDAMPEEQTEATLGFLGSEQGKSIIELELSAREALLDPAIDELNREAARELRAAGGPRLDLVTRFIETNELVDANVAGALTGNVAFLRGLRDGGFPPYARVSDAELIAEAWDREPEIRSETEEWIYAYLTLAYRPLSDADLDIYIAFSETGAGRALNRALFVAFDKVLTKASHALGEAVGRHIMAEEI